jgi:hypothetical protein
VIYFSLLNPGELYCDQKFLGVQWKYAPGNNFDHLVPSLDDASFLQMVLNPRRDESNYKNKRDVLSNRLGLAEQRYLFDWARGIMITCGFSSDVQMSFLNEVINSVPATAVLLEVQGGGGEGEAPEGLTLEDNFGEGKLYNYKNSEGVPNREWVYNLYLPDSDQLPSEEWIDLYPDLADCVSDIRRKERAANPVFMLRVGDNNWVGERGEKVVVDIASAPVPVVQGSIDIVMEQPEKPLPYKPVADTGPVRTKRTEKKELTTMQPYSRDPEMAEQLCDFFKKEYKIACANTAEARALGEKKIKFPEWHMFGVPVKLVQNSFSWSYAQVERISMQAGFLIQNDFIVQNQVVSGSVSVALEDCKKRAEDTVAEQVVRAHVEKDVRGAKKVLRKFDTKAVPKVDIEWYCVPMPLKSFFSIVKVECGDLKTKAPTPELYWALLTTNTFSLNDDTLFRLKFDFTQVDVQQGDYGQIVRTLVSFFVQDWSTGRKESNFNAESIELCLLRGPNKEWTKKVLKNALLGYFFPQGVVPLFLVEGGAGLVVTAQNQLEQERKRREVMQKYFSFGRPDLSGKSWSEEDKETQYHATRVPVVEQNVEVIEIPNQYDAFNMGNICGIDDDEEEVFRNVPSREESRSQSPERAEEAQEGGGADRQTLLQILTELQKLSKRVSQLEASGGSRC